MMKRPTIPDLAKAAGVSISTVNRVINEADKVRQPTRERVMAAAEEIGFYGLGAIQHSVSLGRRTYRLGIILQSKSRRFYRKLGEAIEQAAHQAATANVELQIEYLEDNSADLVATKIKQLCKTCDAIGVVAAEHPIVSSAIDDALDQGIPVCALIGPVSAKGNVGFVGLDNFKKGRMAAWTFDKLIREPGKIGILVGNNRFRNQDINESGFRSYFREHNANFTLLEPLATYESAAVAREMTEKLFHDHPDLCGLFVSGGGITGALAALKDVKRRPDFVTVGYELFDATRAALIDGRMTMALCHPMDGFAQAIVQTLVRSSDMGPNAGAQSVTLEFEVYTSENV